MTAEDIPGWVSSLAVFEESVFEFCKEERLVRVGTATGSKAGGVSRTTMTLPDGAYADIGPGSHARVESYLDTTYTISGTGSISGITAEKDRFVLGSTHFYVSGGPSKQTRGGRVGGDLARTSPAVSVIFRGQVGGNVELEIAGQRTTVAASSSQSVSTPNGTELRFEQNTVKKALEVFVKKGLVTLEPAEIGAGSAVLYSGQSVILTWDAGQKSVDIMHGSGDDPVYAMLPDGSMASVGPVSALRLVRTSSGTYSAQTTKGRVAVLDGPSRRIMALPTSARTFEVAAGRGFNTQLTRIHLVGTYALSGRGSLTGVDADRTPFDLGSFSIPLRGGPMKSLSDQSGRGRLARGTSFTAIRVKREAGGSVEVEAAPQRFILTGGGKNSLRTPNGTEVEFDLDPESRLLNVVVVKGFIGLEIAALESVTPLLLSGQSFAIDWVGSEDRLGLLHVKGAEPIPLAMSNQPGVVLHPGSAVRLKKESPNTYSVRATQGKVAVWESSSLLPLDLGAMKHVTVVPNGGKRVVGLVTRVQLLGGPQGGFKIRINGVSVFGFENAQDAKRGTISRDGVELIPKNKGTSWVIRSVEKPAEVSAHALGEWRAEISLNESATVWYSEPLALAEVTTAQATSGSTNALVKFEFSDGATASMGPYSYTKTDVMKDGSYTFFGSGAVRGITAAGRNFVLGGGTALMNGGMLGTPSSVMQDVSDVSPYAAQVVFYGTARGDVVADANGQKVPLTKSSGKHFTLPNGTSFELTQNGKDGVCGPPSPRG